MSRTPRYAVHDGFLMPLGFPVEGFDSGQRYAAQPGDIFVATYPKCGTTWTQYIVYLLLHGGESLPAGKTINDVFPHLEEVGEAVVRALPEPRLVKTHLPFERTPWHSTARYIYVARNPFDCAVSFYHHTRGFIKHYDFADGTFDEFFECFVRGAVDFGDYFDNLLSWLPRRSEPEPALAHLRGHAGGSGSRRRRDRRIPRRRGGARCGEPRAGRGIVSASSFDQMRVDQKRWSSQRPANMPEFVRKGVVGDWANHFSAEQARRLADRFAERTRGTAAEHLWSELVTGARAG